MLGASALCRHANRDRHLMALEPKAPMRACCTSVWCVGHPFLAPFRTFQGLDSGFPSSNQLQQEDVERVCSAPGGPRKSFLAVVTGLGR